MKKTTLFFSAAALAVSLSTVGVTSFSVEQVVYANGSEVTEQTSVFAIEKMTCATCPITVRKAMEAVEGVAKVTVDFDNKTATVVYNPSVATVEKISAASTNAGYPASSK